MSNQSEVEASKVVEALMNAEQFNWAAWTLAHVLSPAGAVEWACLCAELALPKFESVFPGDTRPRDAILASRENSNPYAAAEAAADAAHAAARAAAPGAAWAVDAAYGAAGAARDAAYGAATETTIVKLGLEIYFAEQAQFGGKSCI